MEQVFAQLCDATRLPSWLDKVSESRLLAYGGGVGATYGLRLRGPGLVRRRLQLRLVRLYPGRALSFEASSLPGRPLAQFRLSPGPGGSTQVGLEVSWQQSSRHGRAATLSARWAAELVLGLPCLARVLSPYPPPPVRASPGGGTAPAGSRGTGT